ncbi:hypothetical protein KSS87_012939 [Heliosperma pusillum]|nr:hypothetical protein KSS87_012939 [Heliosperma pusillum]
MERREEMEKQWKLYEAYNDLHSLAQEFETSFEAPAILVVGHQTDGKSALVEALMGFQFNHVGGGTKTRRPITLHMKYNPDCESPLCFLVSDFDPNSLHLKSLDAIQAYIEAENKRLESEPCQFSSKEIIIKVEYKYCPNLTIIDTPGLTAPAPARKNRAPQAQASAVESLVRAKMQHKEFIILCLEDCSDWSNATTRRVVMQIDPELSRTVIVSTKLDTKIPQFARASDVEVFLSPPACTLDGFILGDSPFFTSVPSGRVGSFPDSVYRSNDEFKKWPSWSEGGISGQYWSLMVWGVRRGGGLEAAQWWARAVCLRETEDISSLEEKLGRQLSKRERSRIGISSLRLFLEELLEKRYIDSVPLIIPLLEKEHRSATKNMNEINEELSMLSELNLKEKGREFHDHFLTKLSLLLKGSIVAPPDKFGETLQDERVQGGAFIGPDGLQFPPKLIPNAGMRLYGGAQYHRAMAEFRFVVGGTKCPQITREEIVNACGVEDIHDGTNYSRTACVIAVSKARDTFEPFLQQLGNRLLHILKRLLPICIHLLQKDGQYLSHNEVFLDRVASAFSNFAESTESSCRENGTDPSLISSSIGSQDSIVNEKPENKPKAGAKSSHLVPGVDSGNSAQMTETRLADLLDNTLWNRRLAPSSERIVYALVQQIFHGIKEYFLASAELKFNCFLLMPIVDKLPTLLREDLECNFENNVDSIFDISSLRSSLDQRKRDVEIELRRIRRLKDKFKQIHTQQYQEVKSAP